MTRVLYLSYDGMCDPLGGSQVLPYLFGLARLGHEISLVSFEKRDRGKDERAAVQQACEVAGIAWHPLRYHKRPPLLSAMYDVWKMHRAARRLHRKKSFGVIHCRSYLPSLVGLRMKRQLGVRFIFDMRGFWADERVEGRIWNVDNPLFRVVYNYFKRKESAFLLEADAIVSLTEAGEKALRAMSPGKDLPITVIPCCVDFGAFPPLSASNRRAARQRLGIAEDAKVVAYLGSIGGNYLLREMLDFFRDFRGRYPNSRFLFLTYAPEAEIQFAADAMSIPLSAIVVRAARRAEVPMFLHAADIGIAFKQPSFSSLGCSPTKLGEMLALELPIVTNDGVGDTARIMTETGAGVVVERFNQSSYREALDKLEMLRPDMGRWRAASQRRFDLKHGIDLYDKVYRLVGKPGTASGLSNQNVRIAVR